MAMEPQKFATPVDYVDKQTLITERNLDDIQKGILWLNDEVTIGPGL